MATEKIYTRVTEAEEMVKALCEKQPKLLWRVRPQMVQVWGCENKERPESKKTLAVIKAVKGVEKAIMQDANLPVRYHIDIFWSDWKEWKENKRQGILLHELLHIHEEAGKLIKHDIEDFSILVDKIGAKGDRYDNFPDLINGAEVEFDLSLLPKTEEIEEEDKDEIDGEEVEKKKRGRPKKTDVKETPKEATEAPADKDDAEGTEETPEEDGDIV